MPIFNELWYPSSNFSDIYPKNIPAKFKKAMKSIFWSYRAERFGHRNGRMDAVK